MSNFLTNHGVVVALVCAGCAVLYGALTARSLLALSPGNERMRSISAAVQSGARAYLNRQYTTIAGVGVVLFIALLFVQNIAVAAGFAIGGILVDDDPGALFIHGRLWEDVVEDRAPFQPVKHDPPVAALDDDFPLRLTTGRRLESFNTGVQTGGYASPLHVGGEAILLAPEDGERYGVADGARVRIVSRRGSVEAPARYDTTLRPGLAFMNLHFPDEVATNVLTIDATDPKSGTAEFKATAIRLEAV